MSERLIPAYGGYRKMRSFQAAQLAYDLTAKFCDQFIDKRSRTHDQMVQAARSGVQNIAEGSMASATSKKMELKLTGVARASLEELLLDYEDFLRQNGLRKWDKNSAEATKIRDLQPNLLSDLSDASDLSDPETAANVAICVVNQASYLLGRQLRALEEKFLQEGGFTERMYKKRIENRSKADTSDPSDRSD